MRVVGTELAFPAGAVGLRSARLVCSLSTGAVDWIVGSRVKYSLTPAVAGRGLAETSAVGDGTRLRGADVPGRSVDALRAYPEDLLSSPLNMRSASFDVTAGSGSAHSISRPPGRPASTSVACRSACPATPATSTPYAAPP